MQDSSFSLLEASTSRLTPRQKRLAIETALEAGDVDRLRELARAPGGYGTGAKGREWRRRIWPLLLGVDKGKGKEREQTCDAAEPVVEPTRQRWQDLPAHRDENQVALDVKRSFIYYPQSITDEQKATLRSLLSWLILATLRRHPQLSYFQGYHDIVSVILLSLVPFETLTPTSLDPVDEDHNVGEGAERFGIEEADLELLERCVERLSLHRIRDSMGKGMDPVMGYLRILHSVLLLSSPSLTRFLTPHPTSLPLFSLSWILTLTAHDLPTLPVVSRLFDFLLSEDPVMVAYVGAGICEVKRPEVEAMLKEWGVEISDVEDGAEQDVDEAMIHHVMAKLPAFRVDEDVEDEEEEGDGPDALASSVDTLADSSTVPEEPPVSGASLRRRHVRRPDRSPSLSSASDQNDDNDEGGVSMSTADMASSASSTLLEDSFSHFASDVDAPAFQPTPSPSPPSTPPQAQKAPTKPPVPTVSIEQLVSTASALYSRFPPSDSRLGLTDIMGPKSCVFTWDASVSGDLDDAAAARIVEGPVKDVVLPDPKVEEERKRMEKEADERKKLALRKKRKSEQWEVTPTKMLVVAGVAGLVVALWTSESVKGWLIAQARHVRSEASRYV